MATTSKVNISVGCDSDAIAADGSLDSLSPSMVRALVAAGVACDDTYSGVVINNPPVEEHCCGSQTFCGDVWVDCDGAAIGS